MRERCLLAVLSFSRARALEKTHTRVVYKNKQSEGEAESSYLGLAPGGRERPFRKIAPAAVDYLNCRRARKLNSLTPEFRCASDFSGKEGERERERRPSFCSTARRRRQRSAATAAAVRAIGLKWSCIFYTRTGVAINQAGVLSRTVSSPAL
jgi:hypothetical protein